MCEKLINGSVALSKRGLMFTRQEQVRISHIISHAHVQQFIVEKTGATTKCKHKRMCYRINFIGIQK